MTLPRFSLASLVLLVATFALDCALLRRYADGGLDTPGLEAGAVLTMTNLLALGLCQACRRGPRAWFLIGFEVAGMVAIAATIVWLRTASATRINEVGNILGHWGNVYLIPFEWLLPGLFAQERTVRDELIGYALTPLFVAIEFAVFTLAQLIFALVGGVLATWVAQRLERRSAARKRWRDVGRGSAVHGNFRVRRGAAILSQFRQFSIQIARGFGAQYRETGTLPCDCSVSRYAACLPSSFSPGSALPP